MFLLLRYIRDYRRVQEPSRNDVQSFQNSPHPGEENVDQVSVLKSTGQGSEPGAVERNTLATKKNPRSDTDIDTVTAEEKLATPLPALGISVVSPMRHRGFKHMLIYLWHLTWETGPGGKLFWSHQMVGMILRVFSQSMMLFYGFSAYAHVNAAQTMAQSLLLGFHVFLWSCAWLANAQIAWMFVSLLFGWGYLAIRISLSG